MRGIRNAALWAGAGAILLAVVWIGWPSSLPDPSETDRISLKMAGPPPGAIMENREDNWGERPRPPIVPGSIREFAERTRAENSDSIDRP